ncbi:hypothetical protein SAMN04487916_1196 [Arthrobacter sp. ov407]|uniref:hypothetical protein n=1 Tax=Arthrobacter sp. ov407 TaxID=1761748 RepID=UPI000882C937|nr:hypothetical protein [Arthrobacter sp. ov407]SDL94950.1 hypothetical protein SAMN04487916_1196 [Arthrobacter sp. ov407]
MAAATVDDILADLPLGFASLMLRPSRTDAAIERFLIVDADDETYDGGSAFVLLIGVRGRSALPAVRRLLKSPPLVLAVKGSQEELAEAAELLRAAGTGLLLVDPAADWDRLLSIAKDRIQPPSYQSEVLTLLEEDLFAIAQTTARLTSSHVVIEDAANKVLAYSTVTNAIDELRKASILARRGPRKYELLLKDLGAYRELHRTRLPVRVPARPQDGLRERVAISLFAGDRIMGYIWLQETGAGFGDDVDYVLTGSAARASAELIRYRNQQSVHMREDRIVRLLSGPAEAAASAHSEKIPADRPAALILVGLSASEAQEDDAALKHGELANLASIHAAAYKPSAIVGQFHGDTAVILPGLQSANAGGRAAERGRGNRQGRQQTPRHQHLCRRRPHRPRSALHPFSDRNIRSAAGLHAPVRRSPGGRGGRLRSRDPLPRRRGELYDGGLPAPQPLGPAPG